MLTQTDIEANWPLTNIKNEKILQKSGERLVVELTSDQGEFVYKAAPPERSYEQVSKDLQVLEYVNTQGFAHSPQIIKTQDDQLASEVDGQIVYVLNKVIGANPAGTVEDWVELGRVAGELHSLPLSRVDSEFTQAITVPDLIHHADQFDFKDEYIGLLRSLKPLDDLPRSIIHTDIGIHNFIKSGDNYTLIDWDDAGNGTRLLDIAFPLLCHFVNKDELKFETPLAKAFYSSYSQYINLSVNEKESLFSAALFYALMYAEYGDVRKKWRAVRWSIEHQEEIIGQVKAWL